MKSPSLLRFHPHYSTATMTRSSSSAPSARPYRLRTPSFKSWASSTTMVSRGRRLKVNLGGGARFATVATRGSSPGTPTEPASSPMCPGRTLHRTHSILDVADHSSGTLADVNAGATPTVGVPAPVGSPAGSSPEPYPENMSGLSESVPVEREFRTHSLSNGGSILALAII